MHRIANVTPTGTPLSPGHLTTYNAPGYTGPGRAGVNRTGTERDLPRRLLGVWAHPDDEAYLSAGLMGRVVDHGGHATVVTATRGEQGTADAELACIQEFGVRRESELVASLGVLGVSDVRFLGLPDGGCDTADAEAQVQAIQRVIDEVDPELIVTFGPDGMTWHPDHRAVSAWTTEAWSRSSSSANLLYATMTDEFAARHAVLHERLGVFDDWGPGHPATIPLADIEIECGLTPHELERKRSALGQHASQTEAVAALFGEDNYLAWLHQETYRRPTATELSTEALR